MKQEGQTFSICRDDHDWLLALGKKEGSSKILTSSAAQNLVKQFRRPLADGLSLPWVGANDYVRFMPGKVSVWSGPTFSGKTAFLRQLMLHAIVCRHKVLFVSLEEEPEDVWREFICMAANVRSPTENAIQWALDTFEERLFVFDSTEIIDPTVLMGIIRYGVEQFGFTHIVIDSLMRLNMRIDDYDGQREMGNMLGRVARATQSHIHLVAHPRKTANSRQPMDLYDIRGAQDIVAQADLVLTLERKHDQLHSNELTVWKQRGDVNWIGMLPLWYCPHSRQLKTQAHHGPTRYLDADAYTPHPEANT